MDEEISDDIDILTQDQKNFISEAVDVHKMAEASREFRRKFDFFVRVNKLVMNLANEKSLDALDRGKQQSIKIRMEAKQCGIPTFYPVEHWLGSQSQLVWN